jgi:hypothetical protein
MNAVVNTNPVAADVRARANLRFRSYPLLSEYFPLLLNNGVNVNGVAATCSQCANKLPSGVFRGEVRQVVFGCYRVTAIGWCVECDLLTPYLFHITPTADNYELTKMEFRGWPEQYEPIVIPFRVPENVVIKTANTS